MKKFTVKDFIVYNNPCFSCGNKISFRFVAQTLAKLDAPVYLKTSTNPEKVEVDLRTTYKDTLRLVVDHKSNKISTNNPQELTKYLERHKLFLNSACNKCYTTIESQFLEFNLKKGFILPVGLSHEMLMLSDNKNMYQARTSFIDEKTIVTVDKINKTIPISPVQFNLPLLPLYKFKTREKFITKITTYLIFS